MAVEERRWRRIRTVAILAGYALGFLLIALTLLDTQSPGIVVSWETSDLPWRLALGGGGLLLVYGAIVATTTDVSRAQPRANAPLPEPDEQIFKLQRDTTAVLAGPGKEGHRQAIQLFVDLVVRPETYQARIVETISLEGRTVGRLVTIELSVGGQHSLSEIGTIFVPVTLLYKGDLTDKLSVSTDGNRHVATLNYAEARHLVAAGLRQLMHRVFGDDAAISDYARDIEFRLLRVMLTTGRMREFESASKLRKELAGVFDDLSARAADDIDYQGVAELRRFVSTFAYSYVVVVPMAAEAYYKAPHDAYGNVRLLLQYRHSLVPRPPSRFVDRFRFALGLRPTQVSVPTDLSTRCGSYHLVVQGPADQYVERREFRCKSCRSRVQRSWTGRRGDVGGFPPLQARDCQHILYEGPQRPWHFRVPPRRGQEYAHLYLRSNHRDKVRNTEFVVRFKEAPPGMIDRSLLVALFLAALVFGVGRSVDVDAIGLHRTLLGCLLLLPAVGAVIFGTASDTDTVLRSSLAARLSFMASGTLSVLATTQLISGRPNGDLRDLSILGVTRSVWQVFLILALANVLFAGCNVVTKYRRYSSFRPSRGGADFDIGWS